jgi:hypothetical protein
MGKLTGADGSKKQLSPSIAILLVLLSCSPDSADRTLMSRTGNKTSDMLIELPEAQQAMHLGHMVDGCDGIRAFYMGTEANNVASWSVGCSNGSSYSIGVENDDEGTTTVLDCLALKAIANIDCFVPLASQLGRPPRTEREFMCAVARLPRQLRERVLVQFVSNLETYLRESGEPVPNTRAQVVKQGMKTFDKYARSCNERPATRPKAAPRPKELEPDNVAKTAAAPAGTGSPAMVDLPRECSELKAQLLELASCSSTPQTTRDALWSSYDRSPASQERVTADQADAVATSCAALSGKVNATLTSCRSADAPLPAPTRSAGVSADDLLRPE